MTDELLIYGSYGYTGALVARTAVDEGLTPVLAGRTAEKVERQATDLGLDHRVFSLQHPEVIERQVEEFSAVLNCAGPFSKTAEPLYSACLNAGTDYLDITGEIDVLEAVAGRANEAEASDVTLLPAVGFDVVPTDCLAGYIATELPSATKLTLAIDGMGTFSPGTAKSIVEGLTRPGAVRRDGEIRTVPAAWKTRRLDFGRGPKTAVTIPWGDVSSAYYTTGIENVETYATVPEYAATVMAKTGPLAPIFGSKPFQRAMKAVIDATVSGPTAEERARSSARVWGEVEDDDGNRFAARMRTPDTYDLTARTAVEAARRVVSGEVQAGYQTPASAFGPEFALEFEGVEREDVREFSAVGASPET
ncbi:saccharopine dehydrogenase NADP-binding domain-containing protein [Halorussus gelatinilyticus]|uniref:Saccharopine dehydrogenase NADP-binding domain-containing protein n=1 Tax=Halorussus gelatinilyticus TaxID=2937524 RepID=A0A8U0IGB7_9EURY|nr:saccharopine dehydrogenase NADP-binding domain-containing protein [Halorussus gelatinilyticus]UPV99281.1 saccharopine dehydrogenase NADP-binding domain-containing protein [Halorussus gelatinilyticus]